MKKSYETPTAEKITFNYRDQVVAASGGSPDEQGTGEAGNIFQSSVYGSCYSAGDAFEYVMGSILGDCDWL